MALINCEFFSDVLGLSVSAKVILPQSTSKQIGMSSRRNEDGSIPWLYLLHGLSDNHSIWLRRTSIERYVADLGIAVVMPEAHKSFYSNLPNGGEYWNYISEEVPRLMREFFPLSDKREDQFVAGLSMGGFGAFKLALNFPERYSAAASLSGALFPDWDSTEKPSFERTLIFGSREKFENGPSNLLRRAGELHQSSLTRPRLYQACGTEDFLYEDNIRFRDELSSMTFDHTYDEGPGSHNWEYWDGQIVKVLDWMTSFDAREDRSLK